MQKAFRAMSARVDEILSGFHDVGLYGLAVLHEVLEEDDPELAWVKDEKGRNLPRWPVELRDLQSGFENAAQRLEKLNHRPAGQRALLIEFIWRVACDFEEIFESEASSGSKATPRPPFQAAVESIIEETQDPADEGGLNLHLQIREALSKPRAPLPTDPAWWYFNQRDSEDLYRRSI